MTERNHEALLGMDDAAAIGFRIVDMADRAKVIAALAPGAQAKWRFEMDGVGYDVAVTVALDE